MKSMASFKLIINVLTKAAKLDLFAAMMIFVLTMSFLNVGRAFAFPVPMPAVTDTTAYH